MAGTVLNWQAQLPAEVQGIKRDHEGPPETRQMMKGRAIPIKPPGTPLGQLLRPQKPNSSSHEVRIDGEVPSGGQKPYR